MWILDHETLAFLDVNEAAVRHYGYSREEFLRMSIRDIGPLEDAAALLRDTERLGSGESPSAAGVWRHRKKDGSLIEVDTLLYDLDFHGKRAYMILARDVTEQRRSEERLRYHARLLAAVNDAVLASDERFVLTAWNTAAEKTYGWKASEVLGRPAAEVLRTEFIGMDRPTALRKLAESGEFQGEVIQYRKDGSPVSVEAKAIALRDVAGEITGYVSVNRDITRRKLAGALRQSEERLRLLVDGVKDYAIFTLDPEGHVTSWNAGAERRDSGATLFSFLSPGSRRAPHAGAHSGGGGERRAVGR